MRKWEKTPEGNIKVVETKSEEFNQENAKGQLHDIKQRRQLIQNHITQLQAELKSLAEEEVQLNSLLK